MSQYRPCLDRWGDYASESICKPYIFHRAVLLNTEIIITTFPKPLIYSAQSIGTYEGYVAFRTSHIFCNNCTPSMIALCAILRFIQNPINFIASISELTYERHIFLPASPAEEKSALSHIQPSRPERREQQRAIKPYKTKIRKENDI